MLKKQVAAIALSVPFVVSIVPQRVEAQAIPIPVVVCFTNPVCVVTSVIVGGVAYWVITQNGQSHQFQYGEGEYLEDPEAEVEEWSNPILADSQQQADSVCRDYAQRNGAVFIKAQRRSQSGRTYDCYFRSY